MKQRITVEQIKELTDEQLDMLHKWWKPQLGDYVYSMGRLSGEVFIREMDEKPLSRPAMGYNYPIMTAVVSNNKRADYVILDKIFPLLSIGQMLQLLDEERQSTVPVPITQIMPNFQLMDTGNLRDALWATVKQSL